MKRSFFIAIFFCTMYVFTGCMEETFPEHKEEKNEFVLVFDVDDVIVAPRNDSSWLYLTSFPWYVLDLLTMGYFHTRDAHGNKKFKVGNEYSQGGIATKLAFYGAHQGKGMQHIIPSMIDTHINDIDFLPGMETLLEYLKNKNYPIFFATNKDAISFYKVAQKMDEKHHGKFSAYPTAALVTQPTKEWLNTWIPRDEQSPTTPKEFKELLAHIHDIEEKENVLFARGHEKPDHEYYQQLMKLINERIPHSDHIYFFDDKECNVKGAASFMQGTVVNKTKDIITALEKHRLIAPDTDKELYDKLFQEGIL